MKANKYLLGLIGKNLTHSFSESYFQEKFRKENINNFSYKPFNLIKIEDVKNLISENPNLIGLNITIPFKSEILKYVDFTDKAVEEIKAANTIYIEPNSRKIHAYNTDIIGFELSLKEFLPKNEKFRALILGSGGASKAVQYVLKKLQIDFRIVSRKKSENNLTYSELSKDVIEKHKLIINTTPLGTFPDINNSPEIDFNNINKNHYLFDLIYNPSETIFLKKGRENGAKTKNGLEMLKIQAEESWKIWQQNLNNSFKTF